MIHFIDLFAGIGGIRLGGIQCSQGTWYPFRLRTFQRNKP